MAFSAFVLFQGTPSYLMNVNNLSRHFMNRSCNFRATFRLDRGGAHELEELRDLLLMLLEEMFLQSMLIDGSRLPNARGCQMLR